MGKNLGYKPTAGASTTKKPAQATPTAGPSEAAQAPPSKPGLSPGKKNTAANGAITKKPSERITIIRLKTKVVPKDGSGCSKDKDVSLE